MFDSNDKDSTGYKAYRRANPKIPSNDERELWVGERVRLLPMPENDVGEEFGIVEEFEGDMFVVTVEARFLEDETDDGLREVPVEYVELLRTRETL